MAGLSQADKQVKEGVSASKIVARKKPYGTNYCYRWFFRGGKDDSFKKINF